MEGLNDVRVQAVKAELMKYMNVFKDEFHLKDSTFGDQDAFYLANKIVERVDKDELAYWIKLEEMNSQTHVGEDYANN